MELRKLGWQIQAPDAFDIGAESTATKRLYGIEDRTTEMFGRQCLLARRLVERELSISPRRKGIGSSVAKSTVRSVPSSCRH